MLRAGQAAQIRALGANFHALAEINWTAWSGWVAANGGDWFAAGVEARRRMAAAGFDVAAGDSWALNELSSAVRRGAGTARQDARDFLRGLYTGDDGVATRGVVFVTGIDQSTADLGEYQARLQDWLEDSAFWSDVSQYVSDWGQEVYGDVREYAVSDAPLQTRRDYLNDYLEHVLLLARAGPDTASAARGFLESAYLPLANAAWQYSSSFGWTQVPIDQMQAYVSAEVYAARSFGASRAQDRLGFVWAPNNASGLAPADFSAQTGALLDRLAAAIRDSAATVDPNDPGAGACGPAGQNLFCGGDVGGSFTEAWKSLATWRPSQLVFTSAPQTIAPAATSAPLTIQLRTATGGPFTAVQPLAVTLTSSSPSGGFAAAPDGPYAPTQTVTIPSGSSTVTVYYQDPQPGSPTLTATAPGKTSATQTETIGLPPAAPPPETTIASAPTGTVASGAATIAFAADVAGSTFECSLDAAPFAACASPATYTGLQDGPHVFQVRAIDPTGSVDPTPAQASWVVDTTPPETTLTAGPGAVVASATARFRAAASESGATFQCSLDGRAFAACAAAVSLTSLADGPHTFRVRAVDRAGNVDPTPAQTTWTVDTTPPQTAIAQAPAPVVASRAATLWVAAGERGAHLECSLDDAPFAPCTSPIRYTALGDATHRFRARGVDVAGNVDPTPAQAVWTVDTTPPDTRIAKAPRALAASRGATFWVAATERGARLECSLDGAAFATCTSPVHYARLADGRHTFRVRSIDRAGNRDRSPAAATWTIDTTPPSTRIAKAPPKRTTVHAARFWIAASERGARLQCSLDGRPFAPCRSPARLAGLAAGRHTFRARALDRAGNVDRTPASYTWRVAARK